MYRGTAELSVPDRPTPEMKGVEWGLASPVSGRGSPKRSLRAAADSWCSLAGMVFFAGAPGERAGLTTFFFSFFTRMVNPKVESEKLAAPRPQANLLFPLQCQDSPQVLVHPVEAEGVVDG